MSKKVRPINDEPELSLRSRGIVAFFGILLMAGPMLLVLTKK